jgi:uncharacterized membrane protein YebE (DUF533 family)
MPAKEVRRLKEKSKQLGTDEETTSTSHTEYVLLNQVLDFEALAAAVWNEEETSHILNRSV